PRCRWTTPKCLHRRSDRMEHVAEARNESIPAFLFDAKANGALLRAKRHRASASRGECLDRDQKPRVSTILDAKCETRLICPAQFVSIPRKKYPSSTESKSIPAHSTLLPW